MPFAFISTLCFSGVLLWLCSKGLSGRFWPRQRVRFGVAIWAVASLPLSLANYTIEPWPGVFVAKTLAWELVAMAALGGLTAALAKGDPRILDGGTF
jgi:hypothetical protein